MSVYSVQNQTVTLCYIILWLNCEQKSPHCNETHDSKQVHKIKIVSLWQIVTIPNLRINVDDDQPEANENEGSVQCRPS